MERKTGKEMAVMAAGVNSGGTKKHDWILEASIPELQDFIHNISFPPYPSDYELAKTALNIRIAAEQSEAATKLEKQTDRLVNQTDALVGLTRKLYLLTIALIVFAVIQTIVMLLQK